MHLANDLILKKRDGKTLSAGEISAFIEGVSSHAVSDAQIAAFAMATWFQGMNLDEQMALTLAMRDSGEVLDWPGLDGPVLDKHSTGGVGDMVSLLLGPIVASCGAYIPMISGRGLGHTGGTLDKLESIPGFDAFPGIDTFRDLVRRNRLAIIGQTASLAPADRRIYAVRDVTATVASTPLIISSILSKKLAEGLDGLVMDIKFGSGAFTPDPAEAEHLAREITRVSGRAGLPCKALVTSMEQPLAWSAGNALEVMETVRFLRGDARHERLQTVVLALSAELLLIGGLAANLTQGRDMAQAALDSGRAAEQFATMVRAQGGPGDLLENAESILPSAPVVRPVFAGAGGVIQSIDTRAVGMAVVFKGGGRKRAEDNVDPAVGVSELASVGQSVDASIPLAVIHAAHEDQWEQAAALIRAAFEVGAGPAECSPVIVKLVQEQGPDDRS